MIKKTIKYEDFNGTEHTEDFYFHLSETELARMEMRETQILNDEAIGGLNARLNAIVKSGSGRLILEVFEDLVKQSYGVRSEDGSRFSKNEEAWNDFKDSGAYDSLFMELVTDAKAAADFVNGIVPKSIAQGDVQDPRNKPQDRKEKVESPSKLTVVEDPTEVVTKEEEPVQQDSVEAVEKKEEDVDKAETIDISNLTPEQIEAIKGMKQD